jgi:hypothetical protein
MPSRFTVCTRRSVLPPLPSAWRRLAPGQGLCRHNVTVGLQHRSITSIPIHSGAIGVETFRRDAFLPATPLILRGTSDAFPAAARWFSQGQPASLSHHVAQHASSIFPYELVANHSDLDVFIEFMNSIHGKDQVLTSHLTDIVELIKSTPGQASTFHQFFAPLSLLLEAAKFNALQPSAQDRIKRIYIAQSQLNDLPPDLKEDLPVPELVRLAGKGDVYDSSIWLGLEPTYTPLHRDPNPNLFLQICSGKNMRLLPPAHGQQLYARIQRMLGSGGHSRFRGTEMMEGPERAALYDAIWGPEPPEHIQEASLQSGDLLFVPKGWWHSVLSVAVDGRINASANWWFR